MKNYCYVIALFLFGLFVQGCATIDLSQYQYLKEPQIKTKEKQKMLVIELVGDPSVTGKEGFSALFETYYELEKEIRGERVIDLNRIYYSAENHVKQ